MEGRRLALSVLLGGVGLGIVSLASPSVRDFADGLLGLPAGSSANGNETLDLRAELAAPSLSAALQPEESDELGQGLLFFSEAQYAQAIPIIGKYALLGDDLAQQVIGGMFAFGKGLPLDREEGLRWLALAAAQGNRGAAELAVTINSTPNWEQRVAALAASTNASSEWGQSGSASEFAYSESARPAPQYDLSTAARSSSYASPRSVLGDSSAPAVAGSSSTPIGARNSIEQAYGSESASRRYSGAQAGLSQVGSTSSIILNRSGPGTYSDSSGDIYAQAGPHGVVNTRTGEFSPTN